MKGRNEDEYIVNLIQSLNIILCLKNRWIIELEKAFLWLDFVYWQTKLPITICPGSSVLSYDSRAVLHFYSHTVIPRPVPFATSRNSIKINYFEFGSDRRTSNHVGRLAIDCGLIGLSVRFLPFHPTTPLSISVIYNSCYKISAKSKILLAS